VVEKLPIRSEHCPDNVCRKMKKPTKAISSSNFRSQGGLRQVRSMKSSGSGHNH
jgi:hypothetical protein